MSLRDDLAAVLARDARYPISAYAFVFETLEHTRNLRKKARGRGRRGRGPSASRHVSGRDLCEGARDLALKQYGLMAMTVMATWGIHSTSDLGNIVYNLIASGDFEQAPSDRREDFNDVFDFEDALRRGYVLALDEVA